MSFTEIIDATTDAMASDESAGKVVVRTSGHLTGPTEVQLRSNRHEILVDEPPALGGADAAPGPVDYAVAALASCQAITYRFWAAKLGIELDDVEITVDADLDLRGFLGADESVRAGFGEVRVKVTPKGPESAERYQELQDAVDAHCPVLDLFNNDTPIKTTLAVPAA